MRNHETTKAVMLLILGMVDLYSIDGRLNTSVGEIYGIWSVEMKCASMARRMIDDGWRRNDYRDSQIDASWKTSRNCRLLHGCLRYCFPSSEK